MKLSSEAKLQGHQGTSTLHFASANTEDICVGVHFTVRFYNLERIQIIMINLLVNEKLRKICSPFFIDEKFFS